MRAYVKSGHNSKDASKIFGISLRTVARWLKMEKQGCIADPKPKRPWKKIDADQLLKAVEEHPGKTLSYFAEVFNVKSNSLGGQKILGVTGNNRVKHVDALLSVC